MLFGEIEKKLESIERNAVKIDQPEAPATKLSELSFGINVHLANKDQILSELSARGILGVTQFGEQSKPPETMKVAVSETIPKKELTEILRISRKLGFTHYGFIEHFEDISEDVLFGAYGESYLRLIVPA